MRGANTAVNAGLTLCGSCLGRHLNTTMSVITESGWVGGYGADLLATSALALITSGPLHFFPACSILEQSTYNIPKNRVLSDTSRSFIVTRLLAVNIA